jgi:hypothetical protein
MLLSVESRGLSVEAERGAIRVQGILKVEGQRATPEVERSRLEGTVLAALK